MQPNEMGAMQNMKVYKEHEWLKEDGEITGVVIKGGVIASIHIRHSGCHSIWYSKPGKRDYRLEDDGTVSLVEDAEEKVASKVKPSNISVNNKKVVPFAKWFGDYVPVSNHTHKRKEDRINGFSVDGLEVMRDGTAKELRITKDYGTFKIDDVCLEAKDILLFTYGLSRDCLDPWKYHSYFNEDYDLIFDDDGKYEYNRGYNGDYFGEGKCGLESIGLAL